MNTAIEMHDSECLAVEIDGQGSGSIVLDAYVHRTEGEPGLSPGEGGIQRIRITMENATVDGEIGTLPAGICEGSLVMGSSVQDNMVAYPAWYTEEFHLKMMFSDDARIVVVVGIGLSVEAEGEFRFVETFAGHT